MSNLNTKKDGDKMISEKLEISEMRYRRLFETAQDGILILDFETGKITDANPFIVNIIDYPLEDILGRELWEIGLFSYRKESELAVIELKEKGYIRFDDMPIQRRNGKITEVEFISNVYIVDDTKVIQCNIRDITERKQVEFALKESEQKLKKQNEEFQKLNDKYATLNNELTLRLTEIQRINYRLIKAKEKAEESDKLKTAFLSNISHEIRTPMNAITGFAALLLEPGLSNEQIEDYVQIINASSMQLMSVISDIIDISKIEAGQITMDSELVNVNELLNELYVTYKKLVDPNKLQLHISCDRPNDLIQVKTDGNRIKQVLCNLMNNAIKFTVKGDIEIGYIVNADFIELFVKDTGIGIAPENHELIFQRFRQVEATNGLLNAGTGLGLSISAALVEKLGGTITVDSKLGIGSTFTLTMPFNNIPVKPLNSELSLRPDTYSNLKEKIVLVVEDEKYNHAYIEAILSRINVKILHAWNGEEAVEQVRKHAGISLVLMDIKMPVMDGIEALKSIKQIRPQLPVIAQTAYALSHDKVKVMNEGFDSYISKPVRKNVLIELIADYFN